MYELWEHQKKAVAFSMRNNDVAMFYDVGTGKSGTAINILRMDYMEHRRIRKTLILGPIIILKQFKEEFSNFSKIAPEEILVLEGSGKNKAKKVVALGDSDKIVLTNYEALINTDLMEALRTWCPEFLICDESHMLKNHSAKRSKRVHTIAKKCDRRVIMTGSPILNNVEDLFMQFKILDNGDTFGTNFYVFRNKYMKDENAGFSGSPNYFPKWVPNEKMFPELQEKIYRKAIQAKKDDCLDLPDFIRQEILIPMSPVQNKAYKSMERDFITFLESLKESEEPKAIVAQLAVTKSMKLLQIASGFAIDDTGTPVRLSTNPKLNTLKELLEQIVTENKVIVWSHFRETHKMISELLTKMAIEHVVLNGDTSASDKQEAVRRFENEDTLRVVVASQAAAGTGVNLKQASYSIYFSKDYSLGKDMQSEARNYRGGSIDYHEKVTRIDLAMEDTLDQAVTQALACKQDIASKIIDYKGKGKL